MGILDRFWNKKKDPCKEASVEELDRMLRNIYYGGDDDIKLFVRETASVKIPWAQVRHLRIIGDDAPVTVEWFQVKSIGRGFHLSADGSWLMVNLPKKTHPGKYLCQCGPKLESLELWGIRMDTLEHLEALSGLVRLTIRDCSSLTIISGLEHLTQLTTLYLSGCEQLAAVPGLEHLTQLTTLKLSYCEQLTALPGLEHLTRLTTLELLYCEQLTALPGLEHLTQLAALSLLDCKSLRELPDGIRYLKKLRCLILADCHFRTMPDWLPEIAEHFTTEREFVSGKNKAVVYLWNTTVDDIPDMSIFDQPYEVVAEFFRNRSQGSVRILNEIKVVFLGDGEAGKTHTIARLMAGGGEPDYAHFDGQSTPGIVIRNKEYEVDGRKFTVHYWDFGGQEIMHSMHRIFLTGRTMYVILLNARDDTQGDRARYWLHNVKSFAPDAPVLLVLNKIDQNENASVDEPYLRSQYEKLTKVVKLSALTFTPERFNKEFTDKLLEEILKTGYLDAQWPISWTNVKKQLEGMKTHYIMGSEYENICAECQVDQNRENLLRWFNDLGVSFCCRDEGNTALEDYVILRPDWITNALYIILFNKLEGAKNGQIPRVSIESILRSAHKDTTVRCTLREARYEGGDIGYVLGVMRKFNLSFPHGTDHEFIPMLCQQASTVDIVKLQKDKEVLEFNMEFDYLPNNLLHRLMVERHMELDMNNVWRTGARFELPGTGLSAVVVIDGNLLRFFVRHTDAAHRPNTYLTALKSHVDRIVQKMGLKAPACQLIYKLDGRRDEFDFAMLRAMQETGQTQAFSMTWRRMFSIADILNQSAPEGLEDERKLLEAICDSCLRIQGAPVYYLKPGESGWGMEDERNRRIRDDLQMLGYDVKDQTQRGLSGSGRGVGELDLMLYSDGKPWTILEALRVSSGAKTAWNEHLDKLLENYNYFGAPCLYLLTYVDSNVADFRRIWKGYLSHIPGHAPGKFTYCPDSLTELTDGPRYVKRAKCRYSCGGQNTTVYHIFALVPKST